MAKDSQTECNLNQFLCVNLNTNREESNYHSGGSIEEHNQGNSRLQESKNQIETINSSSKREGYANPSISPLMASRAVGSLSKQNSPIMKAR